jgi:hypothetical protein
MTTTMAHANKKQLDRLAKVEHIRDAAAVKANLEAGYYDDKADDLERDLGELERHAAEQEAANVPS